MLPEEIVGDENLIARRPEVVANAFDRSLANGSIEELPDRAEGAAKRTSSGRFDQVRRAMMKAPVAAPPRRDEMPRRPRNIVEHKRRLGIRCFLPARIAPH